MDDVEPVTADEEKLYPNIDFDPETYRTDIVAPKLIHGKDKVGKIYPGSQFMVINHNLDPARSDSRFTPLGSELNAAVLNELNANKKLPQRETLRKGRIHFSAN